MNRHDDQLEEISAHLDGESAEPDRIARLLKHDADAARRFAEMASLSARLKSLKAPDVHPAFATRVVALAREQAPQPRRIARWIWVAGAAAAILFVIVAGRIAVAPGATEPTVGTVAQVTPPVAEPETGLVRELDQLLGDTTLASNWEDDSTDDAPAYSEIDDAEVLASMVALSQVDTTVSDDTDMFSAVDSLSESEKQAFRALLVEYAERGT